MDKTVILARISYTELVYGRINKKLNLTFSKSEIEKLIYKVIEETPEVDFQRIGKNMYIGNTEYNIRVTVNTNTCRIITADRILKVK